MWFNYSACLLSILKKVCGQDAGGLSNNGKAGKVRWVNML